MTDREEVRGEIKLAVQLALHEEKISDHNTRIHSLETFRWWLLCGIVASATGSCGSLLLLLLQNHK